MALTQEQLQAVIAAAKAKLAANRPGKPVTPALPVALAPNLPPVAVTAAVAAIAEVATPAAPAAWSWNAEQSEAIRNGVVGKSFVLIGAAGTGKTTTLRGMLLAKLESNTIPMLKKGTQNLSENTPGVALVSYTRRAVRNIARQMPEQLKKHCLTIHRLLEFAPEVYYEPNEEGMEVKKMRFAPQRNSANPLPAELKLIVVDESSMVSIELFEMLLDALPNPHAVQFVFLGDLNQLPPVYGQAILGAKLLELPVVELTQVYRQALESPIISLALAIKNDNFASFNKDVVDLWTGDRFRKPDGKPNYLGFDLNDLSFLIDKVDKKKPASIVIDKPGRGKVTLQVWKNRTEMEVGLAFMQGQLKAYIDAGKYNPDEDMVLCPWNEAFGTQELNKAVADKLAKQRDAEVWEVIAGFQKYYYAVGDKILVDKQEAIITEIKKNPRYLGKRPAQPSKRMDRWGNNADRSLTLGDFEDMDLEALLGDLQDKEERSTQASHIVSFRWLDSEESTSFIDKASEFNSTDFAYVITVHKAQGSECRRVFFLTHYCHAAMMSRELVYTAITRAQEELHIICTPYALATSASKPRIKGNTLPEKLRYFKEKLKERVNTGNWKED
jgi:ATP-dependent exoDNAse (exonuclease V) alpha subunit